MTAQPVRATTDETSPAVSIHRQFRALIASGQLLTQEPVSPNYPQLLRNASARSSQAAHADPENVIDVLRLTWQTATPEGARKRIAT